MIVMKGRGENMKGRGENMKGCGKNTKGQQFGSSFVPVFLDLT